jgi:hypothetical protein
MQDLQEYINIAYKNMGEFLEGEVDKQIVRTAKVDSNQNYLRGNHKILQREDSKWKEKVFVTTKLILQEAKTILNFHDSYLMGKNVSLKGTEAIVKAFNKVYRLGNFNKLDFGMLRKVNRFGDSFEYIYLENKIIKGKIIPPDEGFPIFSEDANEYIGFIQRWTNTQSKITYWTVYYPNKVESYCNEGGDIYLVETSSNASGLPIHFKNFSDWDENFGRSELEDIIPILDLLEDLLSKMADAVYTLSLNPIGISIGQSVEGTISSDSVGYCINLDAGEFHFANAVMDYPTIKLLLDTLHKKLETIAGIPGVAMGSGNIANVSEVSLSMLYSLASVKAQMNEKWIREGFTKRWEVIRSLLAKQGTIFGEDEYIDVEFNYSKPINQKELLENLMAQWKMHAISVQSIIEQSDLTTDVAQELERLAKDKGSQVIKTIVKKDNEVVV